MRRVDRFGEIARQQAHLKQMPAVVIATHDDVLLVLTSATQSAAHKTRQSTVVFGRENGVGTHATSYLRPGIITCRDVDNGYADIQKKTVHHRALHLGPKAAGTRFGV